MRFNDTRAIEPRLVSRAMGKLMEERRIVLLGAVKGLFLWHPYPVIRRLIVRPRTAVYHLNLLLIPRRDFFGLFDGLERRQVLRHGFLDARHWSRLNTR